MWPISATMILHQSKSIPEITRPMWSSTTRKLSPNLPGAHRAWVEPDTWSEFKKNTWILPRCKRFRFYNESSESRFMSQTWKPDNKRQNLFLASFVSNLVKSGDTYVLYKPLLKNSKRKYPLVLNLKLLACKSMHRLIFINDNLYRQPEKRPVEDA